MKLLVKVTSTDTQSISRMTSHTKRPELRTAHFGVRHHERTAETDHQARGVRRSAGRQNPPPPIRARPRRLSTCWRTTRPARSTRSWVALIYPAVRRGIAPLRAGRWRPSSTSAGIPWVYPGDRRITPGRFVPGGASQYQRAPRRNPTAWSWHGSRPTWRTNRRKRGDVGGLPQKLRPLNPAHFRPRRSPDGQHFVPPSYGKATSAAAFMPPRAPLALPVQR